MRNLDSLMQRPLCLATALVFYAVIAAAAAILRPGSFDATHSSADPSIKAR